MMYPLVIASIAVVAIFIERFNYYKKCRSDTQLITGMLREYIPGGKFDELADALAKMAAFRLRLYWTESNAYI